MNADDPVTAFIEAAIWHGSLERPEAILQEHPEIAGSGIHAAAILGDDSSVRGFLRTDAGAAMTRRAPYDGDALAYLCFSNYLRLDKPRSEGFLRSAAALLDAGADPNTGLRTKDEHPRLEHALYGAAGVAHHAELTRLLLERGADPNDGEVTYHSPETYDNAVLKALVESGKLTPDSLATMLLRKADWHDYDGIKFLLDRGADPNRMTRWHYTALHQALRRDNDIRNIELLLARGAQPVLPNGLDGLTGVVIAARRGRADALQLFGRRGVPLELPGLDNLIGACARNDRQRIDAIVRRSPQLAGELKAEGGRLLAEFAGTGNTQGAARLLDLGVDPRALYGGDPYFDLAENSTALHVAAWRARHETVRFLIERGIPVGALDGRRRTALNLAVKACVDSYWVDRRSPESVRALLEAGASVRGISYPCGYTPVDDLLRRFGSRA